MTSLVRREDLIVLEAFDRAQGGRSVFPEDSIDRLVKHGFLELRSGSPILTSRGRTELLRRRALDRKSKR
jgi:hypothetical protein